MNFNAQDIEYTKAWWVRLLKDNEKLNYWLVKLEHTERTGGDDNIDGKKFAINNNAAIKILDKTAQDEYKHASLLRDIIEERKIDTNIILPETSIYWEAMDEHIYDLESMAAVFHLGEALAAYKFEIMFNHSETPSDIKHFLEIALPEETYHAEVFRRLTTLHALQRIQEVHNSVIRQLTSK